MAEKKKILILCIDRDDDIGKKAKIKGPVVGIEANKNAALKLLEADPEDNDANTIFSAIKTYKEISEDAEVEIATLTGSERLGYIADRKVGEQLEKVLGDFNANSCIFVSDGASDEQIMPIIQSRVRIDYVKRSIVKQAEALESTYFVIFEKLKEPQYARIVFGLPGISFLLYLFAGTMGLRIFLGIIGVYFLMKGFGIDYALTKLYSEFKFSVDQPSLILYISSLPIAMVSVWLGISAVSHSNYTDYVKLFALFTKEMLILFPVSLLLLTGGKLFDISHKKNKYGMMKYVLYSVFIIVLWVIFGVASDWVLGNAYFYQFVISVLFGITIAYLSIVITKRKAGEYIHDERLIGKNVFTETGMFLGMISKVDYKRLRFYVETQTKQILDFSFDNISNIGDAIVIKYI